MCLRRAPGRSRVLALFPRNFFTFQKPRWLDHLERNAVLDGDLVFLHGQASLFPLQTTRFGSVRVPLFT